MKLEWYIWAFHFSIIIQFFYYGTLPNESTQKHSQKLTEEDTGTFLFPDTVISRSILILSRVLGHQSSWRPTLREWGSHQPYSWGPEANSQDCAHQGEEGVNTSGKMAPPTCREYPFSVLPCPIVIFLRNRSFVSNTEREEANYLINKYRQAVLGGAEDGAENQSQSLASLKESKRMLVMAVCQVRMGWAEGLLIRASRTSISESVFYNDI